MDRTGSFFEEDVSDISRCDFIPWDELRQKTVFVTGGTGLIGTMLIKGLLHAGRERQLGLKIIALARDTAKAETRFAEELRTGNLVLLPGNVEELPAVDGEVDYIVHGASNTASRDFVERPVETIRTSVVGTENVLRLALQKHAKGFVYLSSMEVYGYPARGHKVTEDETGALTPLEVRNSYPIAKQLCEALTCAYADEYKLHANIIRLTQTFGAGVSEKDNRIFAYFMKCAARKEDIVLRTKGETERSYLYTTDAVTAILQVLLRGAGGQAYNAANEETYCSIAEMAHLVAKDAGISVRYDIQDERKSEFAKTLYMDLDTSLLRSLGWKPVTQGGIAEMYRRSYESLHC